MAGGKKSNSASATHPLTASDVRSRLSRALHSRFALRIHTSILLLWTFSAGVLTTKALLAIGMHAMWLRYAIAVTVAYGAFLFGVRIWLSYMGYGRHLRAQQDKNRDGSVEIPDLTSASGGSSAEIPAPFQGGGGSSGGGGASSSFDIDPKFAPELNAATLDAGPVAPSNSGSGVGKMFDKFDLGGGDGDGCLILFAIMIVIGLIALAIGGAVFVVSAGPEILIDAAFEALLAGGLIKAAKRMDQADWMGSVLRATWKPFAVVLAMTLAFAITAAVLLPQAKTFAEVVAILIPLVLSKL